MITVIVTGPSRLIELCDHADTTEPIQGRPGAERCSVCGVSWFDAERRRPIYQLVPTEASARVPA